MNAQAARTVRYMSELLIKRDIENGNKPGKYLKKLKRQWYETPWNKKNRKAYKAYKVVNNSLIC